MAEFISCFYGPWYLESHDSVKGPMADILAIVQMIQYKQICSYPEAVDSVLASVYKHSWYLDSTLVPLALLDDNVGADEKSKIAQAILAHEISRRK